MLDYAQRSSHLTIPTGPMLYSSTVFIHSFIHLLKHYLLTGKVLCARPKLSIEVREIIKTVPHPYLKNLSSHIQLLIITIQCV